MNVNRGRAHTDSLNQLHFLKRTLLPSLILPSQVPSLQTRRRSISVIEQGIAGEESDPEENA